MSREISRPQKQQEMSYDFPYHYLVAVGSDFSMSRVFDWGLNYASAMEFVLDKIIGDGVPESIVDIGCGDGRFTRELAQRCPGARLLGVDYSEKAIALAKAMNYGSSINFKCADIVVDDLGDTFSTVSLIEVYEHILPAASEEFVQALGRMVKRGGLVHVSVPHKNVPLSKHHFRHFTCTELTGEFAKHFEIVEIVPFEKKSWQRRWLVRALVNRLFILNSSLIRKSLYSYYKRNLLAVRSEAECQRIYLKCRKA